ncbi:MAG TPA: TrpR-like protein [Lachnospiraceae bacterium]|nr:TrpR-like protein [Lachnospiraceae bacterium]
MAKVVKRGRVTEMYEAIMKLQSVEECRHFFEDLCSPAELSAMEQRYAVASLLLKDKVYLEILDETSASTATISRVKRMLNYGTGCLPTVIGRFKEDGGSKQADREDME